MPLKEKLHDLCRSQLLSFVIVKADKATAKLSEWMYLYMRNCKVRKRSRRINKSFFINCQREKKYNKFKLFEQCKAHPEQYTNDSHFTCIRTKEKDQLCRSMETSKVKKPRLACNSEFVSEPSIGKSPELRVNSFCLAEAVPCKVKQPNNRKR